MNRINWKEKTFKFKLGTILMSISLLFFVLLLFIPILDLSRNLKISLASVSFILAEILFYGGGFLLGREIFKKYKALFNPKNWLRNRKYEKVQLTDENTKILDDSL